MSTMFSSPVSISPALVPRTVPEPISTLFSKVTGRISRVTTGHAKFSPGWPMNAAALAEGQLDRLLLGPYRVERQEEPEPEQRPTR